LSCPVTHFEIYAENPAKLAEFYRGLFGWQIDGGGLTYRPIRALYSWIHYVSVPSIDNAIAQVETLGGVLLRPKTAVPKTAWYAIATDPEGNIFAIWQADPAAFAPPEPE
jgi:predicted enzyme related to lactoylglutathione lyase